MARQLFSPITVNNYYRFQVIFCGYLISASVGSILILIRNYLVLTVFCIEWIHINQLTKSNPCSPGSRSILVFLYFLYLMGWHWPMVCRNRRRALKKTCRSNKADQQPVWWFCKASSMNILILVKERSLLTWRGLWWCWRIRLRTKEHPNKAWELGKGRQSLPPKFVQDKNLDFQTHWWADTFIKPLFFKYCRYSWD